MHDTALTPITEEVALVQLAPASPSLAHQLIALLHQVLILSDHDSQLVTSASRRRGRPNGDPHLLPGKLACLFDVRTQRLVRVQFRADVLAACNTAILLLLDGLAPGSLLLADLGYFSFPWFDYLTGQGYFWVSRLKDQVSYDLKEVMAYDDVTDMLDALIWLGKYRANHAVRLVYFTVKGTRYRSITNVLSPQQLSLQEIAHLYARRWDIEMAFKVLKSELGLRLWWGACRELVLAQLWVALILAQLLYDVQRHLALQAERDPSEVSMHVLIELLNMSPVGPTPLLDVLVQKGCALGLFRPSRRFTVTVPPIEPHMLCSSLPPQEAMRHARYARPKTPPHSTPFLSHFQTQLLI